MAVALFFCSTINLSIYLEYRQTIRYLPALICVAGIFGMIGWLVRIVSLSMSFNWFWLLGITGTSLLVIGVMAHLKRVKLRLYVGSINILLIPLIWWYGSKFNSVLTFDWFYNMVDATRSFFA